MSVLFGRWQFDGSPVGRDYMERMEAKVAPYGPDGRGLYRLSGITLGYRAFDTAPSACSADQPYVSLSGAIVTWDGRLDNRKELIRKLGNRIDETSSDVQIVGAAYEAWDQDCFAQFIGDWAMVIWVPSKRALLLGVDFLGTRHLFYRMDAAGIIWSTLLDPLVLDSAVSLSLSEEYLAGWLLGYPSSDLTPFVEIQRVQPARYLLIMDEQSTTRKYWDFGSHNTICHKSDYEYEEHFRTLFSQAVARRLRSTTPPIAELSGGLDSSAIVCMADRLITEGNAPVTRLDTISYFSEEEPHWDDHHFFTAIEANRGQVGCHIRVGSGVNETVDLPNDDVPLTPAALRQTSHASMEFEKCVRSQGNRVILSGLGGDEVLGGVPTPIPELADLLAGGKFLTFFHQLAAWSASQRKPALQLLQASLREFLPISGQQVIPTWVLARARCSEKADIDGAKESFGFRVRPSFVANLCALESLRRQLASSSLSCSPLLEKRYPYLDRDLLEFMYAIPRSQVVRPGQRRSLMRRALAGIVPNEVLQRRRKAFAIRRPVDAICDYWLKISASQAPMLCKTLGLIDEQELSNAIKSIGAGNTPSIVHLSRTLALEVWLRQVDQLGLACRDHSPALALGD